MKPTRLVPLAPLALFLPLLTAGPADDFAK